MIVFAIFFKNETYEFLFDKEIHVETGFKEDAILRFTTSFAEMLWWVGYRVKMNIVRLIKR